MKIVSNMVNIICIITLVLTIPKLAYTQNNCVLKKDQDNIKVYSCKTVDSEFKAVRAEFELNATIDEYIAIVLDVDSYKDWHYRAINPRILDKVSETELIYYTQVSAPWPISNRDLILRLKLNMNMTTKALTVTLKSIPSYLPTVKDFVRVPESYSEMTLTRIENSKLKVEYFIQVDPGGQLPAWLVNLVSTQAPYETFKNLMDRLEKLKKSTSATSNIVD